MNTLKNNNQNIDVMEEKNDLSQPSVEEIKKQELISVLSGLIKNYALKKKQ